MRRLIGLFAALAAGAVLTGCGFSPLYADRGTGLTQKLSGISIGQISAESDVGYFLQRELQSRLGSEAASEYTLTIALEETLASEAITVQANTLRYNFILDATYRLSDSDGEAVLTERTVATAPYGVAPSQYATEIAEEDARRRASALVADAIERDLVLHFRGLDQDQ